MEKSCNKIDESSILDDKENVVKCSSKNKITTLHPFIKLFTYVLFICALIYSNNDTFHKSRNSKNNLTKKVKFNSGRLLGHCKNHGTIYPPFERKLYNHMLHGSKSFNMKDQLEINVEAFKLMDEKLKAYELNKSVSKEPYLEIKQSEQYTDAIGEEEKEALKKYLDAYLEDEIHLKNIHDFMQQTENCRRNYVPMKYCWHQRKIIIEKTVRKFVTSLKHRMKKLITNFNHVYSLMVLFVLTILRKKKISF